MLALKRYGQVQGETASKERLLALLMEAALANIRAGRAALEEGRKRQAPRHLGKASNIIRQFLATLDTRVAPDLCKNLAGVYVFVCSRLMQAMVKYDVQAARDAEKAFTPVAEGFLRVLPGATPASGGAP